MAQWKWFAAGYLVSKFLNRKAKTPVSVVLEQPTQAPDPYLQELERKNRPVALVICFILFIGFLIFISLH